MAAHAHDVAVLLAVADVLLIDLRVHGVGDEGARLLVVRVELDDLAAQLVPVGGRQQVAGAAGDGLLALEHDALQILREAAGRLAHHALEVAHDAVGEGEVLALFDDVLGREVVLHHEDREVADHLGRRRDLDDVAEHEVDGAVHLLDLREAVAEAERLDLRLQVRVLAAGDLVAVDIGDGDLEALVEALVAQAHVGPVIGQLLQALRVKAGVALLTAQGLDNGVHRRLAREVGQRSDGGVDHVHAGLGRHEIGRDLVVGGVVRVQVDGDADLLLEGAHELLGGVGLEQAGHVLDGQHVGAAALELLGEVDVVLERVAVARRVEDVAGVAHGALEELALTQDLVHGGLHVRQPVERVEHAEYVDALAGGLGDEGAHKVVRIARVADEVRAAQQHLERDVRDLLAQHLQALPRGLVQEAVGGVERRAAPHLEREAVGEDVGRAVGALEHVAGAQAGAQQGLVRVAHRRVGDEQLLLAEDPVLDGLGAVGVEQELEPVLLRDLALRLREARRVVLVALGVGVVDLDVGDVFEHAGRAVARFGELEQFRRLVDELRVALAGDERRVRENVRHERDVRLHAAHVLFIDGAGGLAADGGEGAVPARDLDEQGVVVRRDDRARADIAAVETHAEAAAGAVGLDLAVVGREVVGRVLGGHAALDGVAVDLEVVLVAETDLRVADRLTLGDEDLRAHEVDVRDHLGDGVLDLDAGVHLDEVVVAVAVDEELHGAGVDIADGLGDLHGVGVQLLADALGHAPRGRELDDLLVAALQRAVALAEVAHVAVLVGEDLHLDVLGLHEVLLDEDVVIAEGLARLALDELERGDDVLGHLAQAHAAAAAAGRRLEDDGEAEADGLLERLLPVAQGLGAAGDDRHAALHGDLLGRELVAHLAEHVARGADERDAGLFAGAGKVRVLGQEAVARVDGVDAAALGQVDDLGDVEIRAQGALVLADEVGLIGTGAEHAQFVFLGVHGHGVDAEVVARAEDTHRDLAAVGGKDLVENFF